MQALVLDVNLAALYLTDTHVPSLMRGNMRDYNNEGVSFEAQPTVAPFWARIILGPYCAQYILQALDPHFFFVYFRCAASVFLLVVVNVNVESCFIDGGYQHVVHRFFPLEQL